MAQIKLVINPDTSKIDGAVKEIKSKFGELGNIKIKIDSGSANGLRDTAKAANQAGEAVKNLAKEVRVSVGGQVVKDIEVVNNAFGKTTQTTKEYSKEGTKVTTTVTTNYDKIAKAAEKTAERERKARERTVQALVKAARAEEDRQDKEAAAQEKRLVQMKKQILRFEQQQEAADEREARAAEKAADRRVKAAEREAASVERAHKRESDAIQRTTKQAVSLDTQFNNLSRSINNLSKQYPEGTFDSVTAGITKVKSSLNLLNEMWANGDITAAEYILGIKNLSGAYDGLTNDTSRLRKETQKLDKMTESLWMNIQKFARWYIMGNVFTKIVRSFTDALNVMKEVDSELANIQKVTDRTDAEMQSLAKSAYSVASSYGVAATDYLESVSTFAKAGYDELSESLAELATKTQLVGDVTSEIANQFLISVDAAWKMNGNVSMLSKTLDEANSIENNYATSIQKLAEGMPIVASVAANAGMSVEETMVALGTITSVTQETGTKAATALRALILNLIGAAGEYEDGIEVTEESISSLNDALNIYAKDAMEAAKAAGTVINPMTAIAALAEASESGALNQAELFELLSSLGGKLRTNQLTALVTNFEMFNEQLQLVRESAGSADKEIDVMLGTWDAKTKILENTWTEFISKTVSSGLVKFLIDAATVFVDFADSAGLAVLALTGLVTIFRGAEIVKGLSKLKDTIKDIPNLFKSGATWMQKFSAATTIIGAVTTALSIGIMAYRSYQEAQAEAIAKSASAAEMLESEIDKYAELSQKVEQEGDSRQALNEIISQTNAGYLDEADGISDLNELREKSIELIDEERRAKAQAYIDENGGNYILAKNTLANDGVKLATAKAAVASYSSQYERQGGYLNWFDTVNLSLAQSQVEKLTDKVENARKVVETYEKAQSILNGTYDYTVEVAEEAGKKIEDLSFDAEKLADATDDASAGTSVLVERLKQFSSDAQKADDAIGGVVDAMDKYGISSYEVYEAMLALEEAIPGCTDEFYNLETGALNVDAALLADKASLLDLVDASRQTSFQEAIRQLEALKGAAMDAFITTKMAKGAFSATYMDVGAPIPVSKQVAKAKAEIEAEIESWNNLVTNLRSRSSYTPRNTNVDHSTTGRTTSESNGSIQKSSNEKAPEEIALETKKDYIKLLKSELTLLKASGADEATRVAKMREIQAALHDQAEYMRQIGGDQAEINGLSSEWWDIQEDINTLLDEANKRLEESAKAQQEIFDTLKKTVDEYYGKIVSDKEKELDLNEKILAVQKAQDALAKAQAERNVRYYNAATGTWEWGANQKTVKSAQDSLKSAQDALTEYQNKLANEEFKSAWDLIADQIKDGATTFKEAYDYMYQKMTEIQDKYNVDLSGVLETSIGGFKDINKSISDIDKQLIITLMKANSVNWWSADDAGKAYLHAQNENLAKIINATYDANGYWIDENGYRIYDPKDGNPDLGSGASSGGSSGSSTSSTGSSSGSGSSSGGFSGNSSSIGNTSPSNGFYWNGGKLYDSRTSGEASQLVYDEVYAIAKRNNVDLGVAASMLAANVYQGAKYDQGGVLRGIGGIKATMNDEMVLPPDITRAILSPISNDLVRGRLEMMRECLDLGSHTAGAFSGHSIGTQNNGDTYNMNGYTISEQQAKSMTVYDFARLAKGLGISNNRS